MLVARGVVTARGGATSHAAVVCRSVDKPCVCGCTALEVGPAGFRVAGVDHPEGTWLSVDGATGRVYAARIPLHVPAARRADLARVAARAQQYPVSEELSAALRGDK
jgi:pyruvate,orthophosphate dikinase